MVVARVALWRFLSRQRDRGKSLRDAVGDMVSFPGVVGTTWLDSVGDFDVGLSFVSFESREAVEANRKDPRFRKCLGPMAEILERLPPELHAYDVDLARLTTTFGETP